MTPHPRMSVERNLGNCPVPQFSDGESRGERGEFWSLAIWALGACGVDGTRKRPWAALGRRQWLCCPFTWGHNWRTCGKSRLEGSPPVRWTPQGHGGGYASQRCMSCRALPGCGKAPTSSFHCTAGSTAFLSLRINWLILQSALKMQRAVNAGDVSGPTCALEGKVQKGLAL